MACTPSNSTAPSQDFVPATLTATNRSIDDSVRAVIASALDLTSAERDKILLSAPFTTSNLLIIQRGGGGGAKARIANGRIMTEPERFELLTSNGRCWVRHVNTARVFALTAGECPEDSSVAPPDANAP